MTASRLWPSRPNEKWQHRLFSRTPNGTELAARKLIQSAHRNPVESNMRRNQNSNNKSKNTDKGKDKDHTLDTSDLLIESRLRVQVNYFWVADNSSGTRAYG
jgi:phage protein D